MRFELLKKYEYLLVAAWGALLFIPFIGSVHLFDWDEINFAESAREMLVTGNYQQVQINYQPFIEKPPLFFWLQAASMKVFGVNEFAARFPNALIGVATLLFIFYSGKTWFGRRLAWLWVFCITGSITPHLYFKSGIIDPLYNLLITAGIFQLFLISKSTHPKRKMIHSALLGMFLGLAIITKGPVALLVVLLCVMVFLVLNSFRWFFNGYHVLICAISCFIFSAIWFGYETLHHGPAFLVEFVKYQVDLFRNPVAGHGQPFWYHPLVLLLGCFPASVFALNALFRRTVVMQTEQALFYRWMQILFWVVLILFSIVETKIVHYSSLCYLPLTFMAAYAIHDMVFGEAQLATWKKGLLFFIGVFLAVLMTGVTLIEHFKEALIPFIKDEFAVASLQIPSPWRGYEFLLGLGLIGVLISVYGSFRKRENLKAVFTLLLFLSIFIPLYMRLVVPKIEAYSQGPAIEMLTELSSEDCYIEVNGYKSYAHYFYGRPDKYTNDSAYQKNWLMNAALDKPAYFMLHLNNMKDHVSPDMKEVKRAGGFVLMKREIFK